MQKRYILHGELAALRSSFWEAQAHAIVAIHYFKKLVSLLQTWHNFLFRKKDKKSHQKKQNSINYLLKFT